jgi:hypothetical protein
MNSILLEFQQRKLTVLNESLWEWDLIYNIDCDEIKMNELVYRTFVLRIPPSCTFMAQLLDVGINRAFKSALQNQCHEHSRTTNNAPIAYHNFTSIAYTTPLGYLRWPLTPLNLDVLLDQPKCIPSTLAFVDAVKLARTAIWTVFNYTTMPICDCSSFRTWDEFDTVFLWLALWHWHTPSSSSSSFLFVMTYGHDLAMTYPWRVHMTG